MCVCVCVCLQREDLGTCSKIHSEALRGDFEKASQKTDYNVEEEVNAGGRKGRGTVVRWCEGWLMCSSRWCVVLLLLATVLNLHVHAHTFRHMQ